MADEKQTALLTEATHAATNLSAAAVNSSTAQAEVVRLIVLLAKQWRTLLGEGEQ